MGETRALRSSLARGWHAYGTDSRIQARSYGPRVWRVNSPLVWHLNPAFFPNLPATVDFSATSSSRTAHSAGVLELRSVGETGLCVPIPPVSRATCFKMSISQPISQMRCRPVNHPLVGSHEQDLLTGISVWLFRRPQPKSWDTVEEKHVAPS